MYSNFINSYVDLNFVSSKIKNKFERCKICPQVCCYVYCNKNCESWVKVSKMSTRTVNFTIRLHNYHEYWKPVNHYSTQTTIKPLKSGRLGVLKNLSVIERCPLLGGDLKRLSHLGLNVWSTSFFTVLLFSKKEITFMTLWLFCNSRYGKISKNFSTIHSWAHPIRPESFYLVSNYKRSTNNSNSIICKGKELSTGSRMNGKMKYLIGKKKKKSELILVR